MVIWTCISLSSEAQHLCSPGQPAQFEMLCKHWPQDGSIWWQ